MCRAGCGPCCAASPLRFPERARALRGGGVVNVARRALDSRTVAESIGCLVKFRPPRVASPFADAFKFIVKDVPSHRTCRRGYLGGAMRLGVTAELEKSLQESVSQTSHTHSMDELMVTNTVVPMSTRDDQRHGPDHTTKTKLPKSVPEASRRAHTRPLALGA